MRSRWLDAHGPHEAAQLVSSGLALQSDAAPPGLVESSKLDVIRSLAVLLVVLSHLPLTRQLVELAFGVGRINIQPIGLVGVGIFFVHTCFVLMLSLERQGANPGAGLGARTFLLRRMFRIYPLSVSVVIVLALLSVLTGRAEVSTSQFVTNVLLVQNLTGDVSIPAALWSLPFEVQMYLLLPGIYLLTSGHRARAVEIVAALWLGSVAIVLLILAAGLNYHLVKYLPAFLPGVLAYWLDSRRSGPRRLPAAAPALYILLVAACFPVLVAHGARENLLLWPTCLLLGLLIPYSREIRSSQVKRFAGIIAKYSYGIYLVHGPLIALSFGELRDSPPILQWATFGFGTAVLSYLGFHLIEDPGIRAGKRVADALRRRSMRIAESKSMAAR
jgi:peptidoglycan/LPS O-acetylase OafA/YrhL